MTIIDEIYALMKLTRRQHDQPPDLFICSRQCLDELKSEARASGSPIEVRFNGGEYGYRVFAFGIPVYVSGDEAKIQPYINSAKPARLPDNLWKAPEAKECKVKDIPTKTGRRCKQCKKSIGHKHPNAKFCRQKCKDRFHNTHNPRGYYAPGDCRDVENDMHPHDPYSLGQE